MTQADDRPAGSPAAARARELAAQALHAAMREDWPTVTRAFAELSTDGRMVTFALMAWCDTALNAQLQLRGQPGLREDAPAEPLAESVQPAWLDAETGRFVRDADEMPPPARWAGRLLAARAAMDQPQFAALATTMPGDGHERGQYALALLRSTAAVVAFSQKTAARRTGGTS